MAKEDKAILIVRDGVERWEGIETWDKFTLRGPHFEFEQDYRRKGFWYRVACKADVDELPPPPERYVSLSSAYKSAFTKIFQGLAKTGYASQGVNPEVGPRSTVNQWVEFQQENPWLTAAEFVDPKIWKSFIETKELPHASDHSFLRVFLRVGVMDYHRCFGALVRRIC